MSQTKPLTQADLIKTLKKVGVATKDDVKTIVKEQTKNFATKDDVKTIVKEQVDTSERRLIRRMGKMERSLRQSIADLAETTPTRTEFETLKHYQTPLS